jgi:hypothetical protein
MTRPFLCAARASRSGSTAVVVARRGNDASTRFSSVRRRAICRRSQCIGGGDYWIAATAAWTFDCSWVGSGAYPRSCNLPCESVEEK